MNFTSAIGLGVLSILVGQQIYAQELPTFDDKNFGIVSVEPESKAIARSNGRDFYCDLNLNAAAGYVLVGPCLPFVNAAETFLADAKVLGAAKAEADKADAAKAKIAAAKVEMDTLVAPLANVPEAEFQTAIVKALKNNSCVLKDATLWNQNDFAIAEIWNALGIEGDFSRPLQAELQHRLSASVPSLKKAGAIGFLKDGRSIKLKDCK